MIYVVAAMHSIAARWAAQQGWVPGQYLTCTRAMTFMSLPPNAQIHVVDSDVRMQDSANIERHLRKFTNVQRHRA